MTTVSIHMPELTQGTTGLASGYTLKLSKPSDRSAVNGSGDSLLWAGAKFLTAVVAETWSETLAVSIENASGLAVRDGWLASGETIVRDAYPSAGGGGGAGDASQATVEEVLDVANAIAAELSGSRAITPTGRVAKGGMVTAYIGDDFKVRSGTELPIPVADVGAAIKTKLEAIGIENLRFGAAPTDGDPGAITGTISGITAASGITTISVEISNCGADLMPGDMPYQIQQTQTHDSEFDDYVELEGTLRLKARAVAALG